MKRILWTGITCAFMVACSIPDQFLPVKSEHRSRVTDIRVSYKSREKRTGAGGAIVGGLLFGPVGAVVGGLARREWGDNYAVLLPHACRLSVVTDDSGKRLSFTFVGREPAVEVCSLLKVGDEIKLKEMGSGIYSSLDSQIRGEEG